MSIIVPDSTIAAGGWTPTGAASLHAALADEDEDTFIVSPAPPVNATAKLTLGDVGQLLAGDILIWVDAIQVP